MKIIYSVFNIGLLLASDKSFFNLIANNVNINPKTKPYTRPLAKVPFYWPSLTEYQRLAMTYARDLV